MKHKVHGYHLAGHILLGYFTERGCRQELWEGGETEVHTALRRERYEQGVHQVHLENPRTLQSNLYQGPWDSHSRGCSICES